MSTFVTLVVGMVTTAPGVVPSAPMFCKVAETPYVPANSALLLMNTALNRYQTLVVRVAEVTLGLPALVIPSMNEFNAKAFDPKRRL